MTKAVINLDQGNTEDSLTSTIAELLELRDIVGFSADYIEQVFEQHDSTQSQKIVASLCNDLQRGKDALEEEMRISGKEVKELDYNPLHFANVSFLNTNMIDVVTQFTQQTTQED